MNHTPPPDNDGIPKITGWRSSLALWLHYPMYFALVGAAIVRRRWAEWRGE